MLSEPSRLNLRAGDVAQLVERLLSKLKALGLISSTTNKLAVVVHTYNSSTLRGRSWRIRSSRSYLAAQQVQGQSWLPPALKKNIQRTLVTLPPVLTNRRTPCAEVGPSFMDT